MQQNYTGAEEKSVIKNGEIWDEYRYSIINQKYA
jgi:hypothetical protein